MFMMKSLIIFCLLSILCLKCVLSQSFFCNDGCEIPSTYQDDSFCDCSQCEDESSWTCSSCNTGCPSDGTCIAYSSCSSTGTSSGTYTGSNTGGTYTNGGTYSGGTYTYYTDDDDDGGSSSNSGNGSASNTALIVIGVLIGLFIIFGLIYMYRKNLSKVEEMKMNANTVNNNGVTPGMTPGVVTTTTTMGRPATTMGQTTTSPIATTGVNPNGPNANVPVMYIYDPVTQQTRVATLEDVAKMPNVTNPPIAQVVAMPAMPAMPATTVNSVGYVPQNGQPPSYNYIQQQVPQQGVVMGAPVQQVQMVQMGGQVVPMGVIQNGQNAGVNPQRGQLSGEKSARFLQLKDDDLMEGEGQ